MSIRLGIGIDNFRNVIDADAQAIYNRIIADSGVSNLSRLNYLVKGLKTIYGSLSNTPVCYDAHWIGYKLGSGTGATAGQAAAKLYSLTVAGDAVQATAASQPLLLSHNGSDNYWYGSGVNGNYVSTPNAAANQITGDIEIIANINYKNNETFQWIATKILPASLISYSLAVNNGNALRFDLSTTSVSSTSTIGASYQGWVKVTRQASSGDVKFFTSSDNITYTQLGATITTVAGAIVSGVGSLFIGTIEGGAFSYQGKISRLTISNSIGGTPVVDFNPATYNASTSQTAWTSSTGEVWTISTGTATTGYKGVICDRIIVMSDGVDDTMASSTLTSRQYFTSYSSLDLFRAVSADQGIFSNGSLSHLLNNAGNNLQAYNGANLSFPIFPSKLNLILVEFNSISSKVRLNNGPDTTGNSGTSSSTNLVLFRYFSLYANVKLNTLIQPSSLDSDITKTAMYNLIRSLNNNAF